MAILDADLNGPSQAQMAGVAAVPWLPGADGLKPPRRRDGIAVVSTGSVLAGGRPVEFETVSHGDGHVARGVVARSITALAATGAPLAGVIENMAGYWCRDCGAVRPLFPDGAAVDVVAGTPGGAAPLLGRVPFDPELAALADRGWPVEEEAGAAVAAIGSVADRLLAVLGDVAAGTAGGGRPEPEPTSATRPAPAATIATPEEAR